MWADIDPLPAVIDPEAAFDDDAPLIFPTTAPTRPWSHSIHDDGLAAVPTSSCAAGT